MQEKKEKSKPNILIIVGFLFLFSGLSLIVYNYISNKLIINKEKDAIERYYIDDKEAVIDNGSTNDFKDNSEVKSNSKLEYIAILKIPKIDLVRGLVDPKRHLKFSENKYKKLLDNEKLYDYFNYLIFETYLEEDTEKRIPLEFKNIILNARKEFKEYLRITYSIFDEPISSIEINHFLKHWLDKSNFYEKYKEDFINAVYNFDLNNEFGALNIIKKVKNNANDKFEYRHRALDVAEMMEWFCIEIYNLSQSWILNEKDTMNLKYHPIFYDKNIENLLPQKNRKEFENYYLRIIYPLHKSFEFKSGYNLLHQIPKLIEIEKAYKDNLNNLDDIVLDFRTFSANWGNIINLPYWSIIDSSNHTTRGGCFIDSFNYFVVKPGTQKIDFSKVKSFKRNLHNKLLSGNYSSNIFKDLVYPNRSMIFLPKSLDYNDVKTILDELKYKKDNFFSDDRKPKTEIENNENQILNIDQLCSKWLNIICEDLEMYLFIKRYFINRLINKDILPTRIFVNCDPEYYKNYLVEVPSAEVLWHKYDYVTSNYKYKRKYLFDLRGQFNYAKEYLNNILGIYEDNNEYCNILKEILIGSYSSNSKYKEYINCFGEYLLLKEIDVLGGERYTSPEQIKKALYYYNNKKHHSLSSLKYDVGVVDEKDLRLLIEGQKRRKECSRITGISSSIGGEDDCVKTLQRKYKKNI